MEYLKSVQVQVHVLVFWFMLLICLFGFGCDAQPLPQQEVRALEAISEELKNLNWKVHQNSCINGDGFSNIFIDNSNIREVNCTCNSTICNILTIRLKGLNLVGTLPAAFANLTRLNYLDLSRNFINGSIPKEFGRIPLVTFNMVGNRLNGQIPQEIGDIGSLEELNLEENELEGSLPERLGKLSHLRRLLLSSNNFTGSIPQSFGNLRNMTDFWIDGNDLSGKLPEFIGNWTKLYKLHIQGTSMENPIPRAISGLENLTELMITDLKGPTTSFPNLTRLENLQILVLRNCLIEDSIPSYLGQNNVRLRTLDLSFNRLSGPIPETLQNLLTFVKFFMFLNNNSLSGQVPSWIVDSQKYIDLSYNNFTGPPVSSCPQSNNVNLVSSYSTVTNNTDAWCLKKDLPCPREARYDSLFINCGGERREVDGNEYESDETLGGKANFFAPSERWGYSSTGSFLINNVEGPPYKAISSNVNSGLYATARLAPVSLKYYGFCLHTGSYNVKLHFAEIMFTANQTFTSLGRRFFDVSIQGKLVRKNFNIMEEAGGVGKYFVLEEPNIQVTSNTLEIHLYWAGKGTTAIPVKGVYGPLISAITVTPNFDMKTRKLSAGAIACIVVGISVMVAMVLLAVLRRKGYLGGKETEDSEVRSLRLQTGYFSLRQIKAATNNFDSAHKIGEGGFGPVYKGVLSDGTLIAVKQLSSKSSQGNREFITEIGMISALQHPNLVKLYGCCVEGNQLLLIYEYLENNCLARALFGPEKHLLHLEWAVRMKICLGIATGLAYLHEESRLKIIHRDIKATNVLLDRNLNAKISDFGLAKLYEEENTHISTRIAGTIGYMAPEYATRGYLTDKADVYSFGIVALEIVSGKSNTKYKPEEKCVFLLDWACVLQKEGNLLELVDPSLGSNYSKEEVLKMLHIALLCTNLSPTLRPSMSSVVSMLEGNMDVQSPSIAHNQIDEDSRFNAYEILQHSITSSTTGSTSWMDSPSSTQHKDGTQYYSSTGSLLKYQ